MAALALVAPLRVRADDPPVSLLTLADTLARSLFSPQQIPVGIFMALLGVPVFVWLLQK